MTSQNSRPVAMVGNCGYFLTDAELLIVRKLARSARLDWRPIAARPAVAGHWVAIYRQAGGVVADALEIIAAENR